MSDTETPSRLGWARLWSVAKIAVEPMPRAGAWYQVVGEAENDQLILDVLGQQVPVQRKFLERREQRPGKFTLVAKARSAFNPAKGEPTDLGNTYAVCPACGARAKIPSHEPAFLTCDECGHKGEVAYWETS